MEEYTYLIIGGGMTSDSAVRGIREHDLSGRIGVISEEDYFPYNRPPLTKGLWMGKPYDSIWRKTDQEKVTFHLGAKVNSIDPIGKKVFDANGNQYSYQKLLLATGGAPRQLSCPNQDVIYYRTLKDYHALRSLYEQGDDFIVIGSGYIAIELAASLTMNGKKVKMIFQEPSIGSHRLPKKFSLFLNAFFTEKGVQLIPNESVIDVNHSRDLFKVKTSSGKTLQANGVIADLGILPNTKLGESIGLIIENGIVVDRYLQTSIPDIYSAGDVVNFYSPHLDRRLRAEYEDAANSMGKIAGKNMAGEQTQYNHLPYFYSEFFELVYEAVGEIDTSMEIIEDWQDQYRKGSLYYLKDGALRGAMFWGIWGQIDRMRELIASKEQVSSESLGYEIDSPLNPK